MKDIKVGKRGVLLKRRRYEQGDAKARGSLLTPALTESSTTLRGRGTSQGSAAF